MNSSMRRAKRSWYLQKCRIATLAILQRIILVGKLHRTADRLPSGKSSAHAMRFRVLHLTRRNSIDPPMVGISKVSVSFT
jgi:hypothetical protein